MLILEKNVDVLATSGQLSSQESQPIQTEGPSPLHKHRNQADPKQTAFLKGGTPTYLTLKDDDSRNQVSRELEG